MNMGRQQDFKKECLECKKRKNIHCFRINTKFSKICNECRKNIFGKLENLND